MILPLSSNDRDLHVTRSCSDMGKRLQLSRSHDRSLCHLSCLSFQYPPPFFRFLSCSCWLLLLRQTEAHSPRYDTYDYQWRIQDFLTEGSELSWGPRYPVSKTENSSDLIDYFFGWAPKFKTKKKMSGLGAHAWTERTRLRADDNRESCHTEGPAD